MGTMFTWNFVFLLFWKRSIVRFQVSLGDSKSLLRSWFFFFFNFIFFFSKKKTTYIQIFYWNSLANKVLQYTVVDKSSVTPLKRKSIPLHPSLKERWGLWVQGMQFANVLITPSGNENIFQTSDKMCRWWITLFVTPG